MSSTCKYLPPDLESVSTPSVHAPLRKVLVFSSLTSLSYVGVLLMLLPSTNFFPSLLNHFSFSYQYDLELLAALLCCNVAPELNHRFFLF